MKNTSQMRHFGDNLENYDRADYRRVVRGGVEVEVEVEGMMETRETLWVDEYWWGEEGRSLSVQMMGRTGWTRGRWCCKMGRFLR